jgi:hypothetical protein
MSFRETSNCFPDFLISPFSHFLAYIAGLPLQGKPTRRPRFPAQGAPAGRRLQEDIAVFRFRIALFAAVFGIGPYAFAAGPQSVLPPGTTAKGWKQLGATKTFNSRTIFDLVDGEGEAILAYAFQGCAHGEYGPSKAAQPALTIDVYDMTDALNAYGLYSSSDKNSGKSVAMGSEGVRIGESGLNFWKGRYLVRTTLIGRGAAFPSNQTAQLAFAKAAAARITGAGGPPALLKALPAGRQPRSERYTRANVAGHSFLNNAVSAKYPSLGFGAELFISDCRTPAAAKASLGAYRAYEKSGTGLAAVKAIGDEAFSVLDRFAKNVVAARKGKYVVGVSRAKDAKAATALVKKAVAGLK